MDQSESHLIRQDNTRDATNSLKGFAILIVLANHFLNQYVDPNNFSGLANATLSIFFIVSGYGIAHSLEQRSKRTGIKMSPSIPLYRSHP
jgi:peptidoglycan/LPS O-acetylase OafA/YrhL